LPKCFNGHRRERPGCAGCHHAFHVVAPGKVVEGRLVPPAVKGPNECELCHNARHHTPVSGCPQCEGRFEDIVHGAMVASQDVRTEIWQLRFLRWFIGWQAGVAGWLGLMAGVTFGDWWQRPDGSYDWFKAVVAFVSIPLVQWAIRRRIAKRERLLPRLGPTGDIVYGTDGDPGG
jgi:hypothetical protein